MNNMLTRHRNSLAIAGSEPTAIAAAILLASVVFMVPLWPSPAGEPSVRSVRRQTRGPVIGM